MEITKRAQTDVSQRLPHHLATISPPSRDHFAAFIDIDMSATRACAEFASRNQAPYLIEELMFRVLSDRRLGMEAELRHGIGAACENDMGVADDFQ